MLSIAERSRPAPEDRLDRVFHALSDRTRRSLLDRLARGPAIVSELAQPFAMSLPAVSKHLGVLEEARLVVRQTDGRVRRCALTPGPMEDAQRWLERYRSFWEDTLDALERYVEGIHAARRPRPRRRRRKRR